MSPLRIVLILILGVAASNAHADDEWEKVAPLFSSDEVLAVTINAPFSRIMDDRSTDEELPATLTYTDAEAGEVTVELAIRTRGRFRRQKRVCSFAPLRLDFRKSTVKGTVFARSDKLKLVTHCRTGNKRYQQSLLAEFMAYRIFNLVTERSFRVRPLQIRYVDSENEDANLDAFAFIIEHREQLGERLGLKPNDVTETKIEMLDAAHTNLASLFQFMIGNTDFSPIRAAPNESCCHNNMLFGEMPGQILAIPYDFDQSGIVNAPHGAPNPRFGLRNVRDRLYRGRCANNEHVDTSVQAFIEQKATIYALFDGHAGFSRPTLRQTRRFLDAFFEILENPEKRKARIVRKCI
ncbi:MAG: hypothetical protein QNJ11_13375 [Woeseiaceae bacterium]|nr:hypothetical protein [Woeseiaceae bacterium]